MKYQNGVASYALIWMAPCTNRHLTLLLLTNLLLTKLGLLALVVAKAVHVNESHKCAN